MIYIDQFFTDMFGNFSVHARIILTFWLIIGGGYYLARIPHDKRTTVQDYRRSTKTLLIFVGLLILVTVFIVISYIIGR
jgi:signal transduction histidine kinase